MSARIIEMLPVSRAMQTRKNRHASLSQRQPPAVHNDQFAVFEVSLNAESNPSCEVCPRHRRERAFVQPEISQQLVNKFLFVGHVGISRHHDTSDSGHATVL